MSRQTDIALRILFFIISIIGLLVVFLFQHTDMASLLAPGLSTAYKFIINRMVRYLLNDFFMILLIYGLFKNRQYLVFAVYVQLFGMVFFLFPYFILKLYFPHYNGPLISFLHRLIINPLLLTLLIPAFYYQQKVVK